MLVVNQGYPKRIENILLSIFFPPIFSQKSFLSIVNQANE